MKKIFIVLGIILLVVSSCQKEKIFPKTFTARIENCAKSNTKIHLLGNLLKWDGNESVRVYTNGSMSALFNVIPQEDSSWATLNYENGSMGFGHWSAIYPASYSTNFNIITLPPILSSADAALSSMPMLAESDNQVFQFKNLCGILKIRLMQSGEQIRSIKLTASMPVSGDFIIGGSTQSPTLTPIGGNVENSIIVEMEPSRPIDDSLDFYIALPAGLYSNIKLEIMNAEYYICEKNGNNVLVERSKIHTIRVGSMEFNHTEFLEGELVGTFSVSTSNKIRFSKGNLQYQASTNTWRFANNQYDIIGNDNSNISVSYTGWIDLFARGTSGYMDCFPWAVLGDNWYDLGCAGSYIIDGTNYDWGIFNGISNGGNQPGLWRSLTTSEWSYLFYRRNNADQLYGIGTVCGVHGIIVLPDSWVQPNECTFIPGLAQDRDDWTHSNIYTQSQWNQMESFGAVFLPAAGVSHRTNVRDCGSEGYYWTLGYRNSDDEYTGVWFCAGILIIPDNPSSWDGESVRLVHSLN